MFTLPQWIARLTKGYVKVTGKQPDGLAKLKIKMEAGQKVKDQEKDNYVQKKSSEKEKS